MHWECIKIINKWIWAKEVGIHSLNTLDVKCTHMGDSPKFGHIYDFWKNTAYCINSLTT